MQGVESAVIEWLIGIVLVLIAALVGGFVWWVKHEFTRQHSYVRREFAKNDAEHMKTYNAIIRLHKRMDTLVKDKCYEGPKPEGA
jgi:hypothetical protein